MPQSVFPKKKHPIFAKRPIFILEKGTYFFCHMNPNFVNGPFVTLKETVHCQPWEQFLDFLFPSYGRFRKKKKTADAGVGHHLPVAAVARAE